MISTISNRDFLKALGLAVAALAASAALLIPGYLWLVPVLHPEFRPYIEGDRAEPIAISGNRFRPVVAGDSGVDGSAAIISELAEVPPEDHAVLVHRRLFRADQFPFLRYHIEGRNPALQVMLFWQRADAPGINHFAELDYSGEGPRLHNLLRNEEWRGTITELAVGFFGDLRGQAVKLHGVELEPYSRARVLQTVWDEWRVFAPWSQSSINVHRGAVHGALIFPVPAISSWIIVAVFLIAGFFLLPGTRRKGTKDLRMLAIIFTGLLSWLALDAEWTRKLMLQHYESRYLFAGKSVHERMLADWDAEMYYFAITIKRSFLPNERQNIAIFRTAGQSKAYSSRLLYHLLPEHHVTWMSVATNRSFRLGKDYDYVIILSDSALQELGTDSSLAAMGLRPTGEETLIYARGTAALFKIHPDSSQEQVD